MIETKNSSQYRFLIASIIPHKLSEQEAFYDIKELRDLVDSYEGKVVEYVIQHREVHDKGPYLGTGKISEIADLVKEKSINVVVLNAIVKSGHIFDIKKTLEKVNPGIEVWDRVDLILHIFSRHANTTEAKLQIELAVMRHMGPRIYGLGYVLSRQGGSIGTRGIGETNTELMKRHWSSQIKKVEDKLEKHAHNRELQLERRRRAGMHTISIVGYTNAGKTSLFNLLTKRSDFVKDALFATLDSHVGKLFLPEFNEDVIVSDTIGFIHNLPAKLVEAFRSTLIESLSTDLLIHVIDAADPDIERKMKTVSLVLNELHVGSKPQLLVFNKTDLLSQDQLKELKKRFKNMSAIFISVRNKKDLNTLISEIQKFFVKKDSSFLT
jgi:GTP-binding protein HflX